MCVCMCVCVQSQQRFTGSGGQPQMRSKLIQQLMDMGFKVSVKNNNGMQLCFSPCFDSTRFLLNFQQSSYRTAVSGLQGTGLPELRAHPRSLLHHSPARMLGGEWGWEGGGSGVGKGGKRGTVVVRAGGVGLGRGGKRGTVVVRFLHS